MSRDYLSIHSIAPNERVQRPDSTAPSTLGTPSRGPMSAGGVPRWDPYASPPSVGAVDPLDRARALLTHGAAMIDDSDNRTTYLDLVRFIDAVSEVMEAMDILADLVAPRRAEAVRGMRIEIIRLVDAARAQPPR